ncbi:MAG TPA: hypothetical protein VJN21_04905 [Candidatus Acidoferrales bacterium]|nr:hypothetical protein [Candidatus Acidoferrales bacterium]
MKIFQFRPMVILSAIILLAMCGAAFGARHQNQAAQAKPATDAPQQINKIDGGVGPCRADFTVKDGSGKPLYNAKINVVLRYGFMSLRKTELELGTDSAGKARFTGLPEDPKKPLAFHIKSGDVSHTVTDDPSISCNATFDVTLTIH